MKKLKANEVICDMLTEIMIGEMMKTGEKLGDACSRLLRREGVNQAIKWLSENRGSCVTDAHSEWVKIYREKTKGTR